MKYSNASLLEAFRVILNHYFGDISLNTIEKLSFSKLEKFNINDLQQVSDELFLDIKKIEGNINKLDSFMLPCIAYNSKGEFITITDISKFSVTIKRGFLQKTETIQLKKLQNYKNFILFANKDNNKSLVKIGKEKDKSWFFNPIKKEWRAYVEIAILTIFINIFALAIPLFSMSIYNRVIPNFAVDTLFVLAIGVGLVLLFELFLKNARLYILDDVVKRLSNYFEEELFKRTMSIQNIYDNYMIGTKTNLFRELNVVKDFFSTKMVNILDIPFFIIAMVVIYIIDPTLVIAPLVASFFMVTFNIFMQYPILFWHKKSFEYGQTKQGYLVEHLQGSEAIKLSNALPSKLFKWRRIINFYHHIHEKISILNGLTSSISQAIMQLVYILNIVVGVYSIHKGNLNVGGLIAITILTSRSMALVFNFSSVLVKYRQVRESLESLNRYWHLPIENQKYHQMGFTNVRGSIEFDNVSFAYDESSKFTIKNVSFSIKAGERVGIIGQTGSGKSTIVKLLTSLISPTKGKIYIDDNDINTLHPVELRDNITIMPQEPYIFSGTLKENIELGKKISKEQMTNILRDSGLIELVKNSNFSDSLNVGERGSNLSVGQRHLIGLARALVSNSPIVILDEPTTGLDVSLEKNLVTSLKNKFQQKTMIVITHRFAALDMVDRVIVLNNGQIVADGNKDEILRMLKGVA